MDKCFQMDVPMKKIVRRLHGDGFGFKFKEREKEKSQDDAVLLVFKNDFSCIKSMPHKQNQNLTRRNIVDFSKNQWE